MNKDDHLFLIDGSGYIFRAYHALPPLTRKSDGLPIGAVSGFCNMIWKLLSDARDTSVGATPTHLAVIFDHSAKTFRKELFPEYKANRSAPPEDLVPQFGLIREATRAFNLPCVELEGYEADDLIATYARQAEAAGAETTIISSDKDLMQLVTDRVSMYDTMKDRQIRAPEVIEKFGVPPEMMIDLQSMTGDSTDNIPGIPGIGPKTAAQLLETYGDLDTLLERASEIKQNKRRENIIANADMARLSRELVTLKTDTPVVEDLGSFKLEPQDGPKLIAFLKTMEFNSLIRRVAEATETDAAAVDATTVDVEWGGAARGPDLDFGDTPAPSAKGGRSDGWTPQDLVEARVKAATKTSIDTGKYDCLGSVADLDAFIAEARETGFVAVKIAANSTDAMQAEMAGFSLAFQPQDARSLAAGPVRAAYVPLAHRAGEDLLAGGLAENQLPFDDGLARLKHLLEDPSVLKVGYGLKQDWLIARRYGIDFVSLDDTLLISYALDAGRGSQNFEALSDRWFGHKPMVLKDLTGSGKSAVTFEYVDVERATAYAGECADIALRLWQVLKPRLAADGLVSVYERLERPMVPTLACMEQRGISVDRQILSRLSGDFAQGAAALEAEIQELAGEEFNIGSPRQLGEILFGKMGLPGGSKTKTGQWSTSAQVLEELAAEGHEFPRKIVEWRQLTKLKSTYTDALPGFINQETQRVHTSYALASTTTGRLSSSDPNLQNIPIRTAEGRKIRAAFVAEKGTKLVSADYSQIELRVLAHVADIDALKQAFTDGLDIHAMTASEMFGVPVKDMPSEVRRRAKAINFGIIYGISAFGLANQLGIPRSEASDYIKTYFERFPGIKDYMDSTKAYAREHGYVETIFGRRAHYPDIVSSNPHTRSFNERAAINAPIQGSAADIIRRAMVKMDPALEQAGLTARMLLQVHDELVFEVPDAEVEPTIALVTDIMQNAAMPAVAMKVPLQVDARAADNWDEAH